MLDEVVFDPDKIFVEESNDTENEKNKILGNSDEAIKFIAKILKSHKDKRYRRHWLRDYICNDILACFSKVDLPGELKFKRQLEQLSRKIEEINSIEDLKDKTFVGIGGGFSAGKSRFINSLLGDGDNGDQVVSLLPEDQGPTTSIPSFIVSGMDDEIYAVTSNCPKIPLSFDEVQALAHQFYDVYHFGFNQFIKRLVVKTKKFPYKNVTLLDTPGYTKDNEGTIKEARDVEKAKEQLKMVDYLIWVIDPDESGGLTASDVKFITELGLEKSVTFVINKCDKVPEGKVDEVIEAVKQVSLENNISINKIFKYSSFERKGFDRRKLEDFLREIDTINTKHNLKVEIENIICSIQSVAQAEYRRIGLELSNLNYKIDSSFNPLTIKALVAGQKILARKKALFREALSNFEKKRNQFNSVYSNCKIEIENSQVVGVNNRFLNTSNRTNAAKSINLLAKILEEKNICGDPELGKKYSDIYSFLCDDITDAIEDLNIVNKAQIIEKLFSILESVYLLVMQPKLIGKTIVVFTADDVNDHVFKRMLLDGEKRKLWINSNLITFFFPGDDSKVYACNRTDNNRILNRQEYKMSNFLWRENIDINSIAKFFAIDSHKDYGNTVFVYVPKYSINSDIFCKLSYIVDHVVGSGSRQIYDRLNKRDEISCRWLQDNEDIVKDGIKENTLTNYLQELNKATVNYLFSYAFRSTYNDVLLELHRMKNSMQEIVEDSKIDSLYAEDNIMCTYIREMNSSIAMYMQQQDSKIKKAQDCFEKLIMMSEELEHLFESKINLGAEPVVLKNSAAIGIIETCVGYKELGKKKEYDLIRNLLEQLSSEKVFLLQLWNKKGYSSTIILDGIKKLREENKKYPLIRKLLIKYKDKVFDDDYELVRYIEKNVFYANRTYEECVFCGDYYLYKDVERAFSYYFYAAEINPEANDFLSERMLSVTDTKEKFSLEKIANLYNGKGIFYLAESISRESDPVRKKRLYKIAAALGNDDAVVRLLKEYSFQYRGNSIAYRSVVVSLANYLVQKGVEVDTAKEILGKVAYDNGDYMEAEQKWCESNTKYAAYNLGCLYQFGKKNTNGEWVFSQNLIEARNCFQQAINFGHPKAAEKLKIVNEWIEKNNIQQSIRENQKRVRSDYRRTVSRSGGSSGGDGCVPSGTLVTMSTGQLLVVEKVKQGDTILAFNHFTGKVEQANVFAVIDHGGEQNAYKVLILIFSDGTKTCLIKAHCYFDATVSRYVEISDNNYVKFINHEFLKVENKEVYRVKLVDVVMEERHVAIYEIVTSQCLNFITDNILSASMYLDKWLNIFDFSCNDYRYNSQQIEDMVNRYGLANADDFPMLSPELFNIGNGRYFKAVMALGKINDTDIYKIDTIAKQYLQKVD